MPQIFRIAPYSIYFWSNESDPLEPIHVHISEWRAISNATKIWITTRTFNKYHFFSYFSLILVMYFL